MKPERKLEIEKLPGIGVPLTVAEVRALAAAHRKWDIVAILDEDPPTDIFASDGCTLWPDTWGGISIYEACFWHDVRYWCGRLGDEAARDVADRYLESDVYKITNNPTLANTMYVGVQALGGEEVGLWFSWGFGRV
jgi:hypothetical protein